MFDFQSKNEMMGSASSYPRLISSSSRRLPTHPIRLTIIIRIATTRRVMLLKTLRPEAMMLAKIKGRSCWHQPPLNLVVHHSKEDNHLVSKNLILFLGFHSKLLQSWGKTKYRVVFRFLDKHAASTK